ncbi:cyclic nucleotide-binding domain-containing protein [Lentilitoribacter sp. EG35]|uniref:cyclic nucleotide-binding domain-containing protein n=1 Tax=Lentilitoribacter sp. EG35 TaxID=3234192 RepID=UPI00345F46BB
MRPTDLPIVRELNLFSEMAEVNFQSMMEASYLQTFPAHVELIREGDPADFLYIVVEGSVELFAKSNGREATMGNVRPVGAFILAAVLKDAVYLMSARTSEKSRVLMIPSQNVREAFETDDAFTRSIVVQLANCYRGVVKEYKDLKLRTAVERLANRLLRYHKNQGANGSIELHHDKRKLASLLGMTPENLSRAFNTLKPYGVQVDGSKIHLNDLPALETLAKPNELIDNHQT